MKKLLESYTAYNLWANEKLATIISALDESLFFKKVPSSFPNLFETVEHIWQAELVWMQRIQQIAPNKKPEFPTKDMKALLASLLKVNKDWISFIEAMTEENLVEIVDYNNWQGAPFSTPVWQIVHHVFNHSTFHRGQLITMLRHLGVTSLPSTDYITYTRIETN